MNIKSSEVIGLKIITLTKGKEIDNVNDIIFDPESNRVLALLVDNKGWFKDAKVIMFDDVQSIGEDAIMVQTDEVVRAASDVDGRVSEIARGDNYLSTNKIVTEDGTELGKVIDLIFDSESGNVSEFIVSQGALNDVKSGRKRVHIDDIVTVGEDATIVRSYTEEKLDAQAEEGGIQGALNQAKEKGGELLDQAKQKASEARDTIQQKAEEGRARAEEIRDDPETERKMNEFKQRSQEFIDKAKDKASEVKDELGDTLSGAKADAANRFENLKDEAKKQVKEDAAGKYLTKNVFSLDTNQQIGSIGDMVTPEMIEQAEQQGVIDQILRNVSTEPVSR